MRMMMYRCSVMMMMFGEDDVQMFGEDDDVR